MYVTMPDSIKESPYQLYLRKYITRTIVGTFSDLLFSFPIQYL